MHVHLFTPIARETPIHCCSAGVAATAVAAAARVCLCSRLLNGSINVVSIDDTRYHTPLERCSKLD